MNFPKFGSPKKNLKIPTNSENKNFEKMLKQFNVPEPPQLIEARRELEQTRAAAGPQNPMTQELELKVREMETKQSPQATGAGAGAGNTAQVPRGNVGRASGNGNGGQVPRTSGNGNRTTGQTPAATGNGNALQKVKNEANAERRRIEANAARARANLEANARRVQNNLKAQLTNVKNANKEREIQARLEKNRINLETKKAELAARTERNKAALEARVAERQANVNLRKAELAARAASASGRSGPGLWNKVRNMVKKKPGTAAPVTRERVVEILMEAGASRAQINEVRTSGNFRQVVERLAQSEEARVNSPEQDGVVMGYPAQAVEIMQNAGAPQAQINAVQASPNPTKSFMNWTTTTNRAKKAWAAFRKKAPPVNERFLVGRMFFKKNLRNIFALPKNERLSNQNVYLLKEMYGSRNKLVGPWKNFASLKANYERLKAPKKESLENLLKRNNVNFHNIEQAAKGTQYQKLANAWAQTNNPVYLKALKNAVIRKKMIGNLNEEWKKIQQRLNEKNAIAISNKYVKNAKSGEGWEQFVAYEMMLNEANAILKKKETNSFASSQQKTLNNQQRAASIAAVEKLIKEANTINRVFNVGIDAYPANTQKRLYATKKERIKELLSQMNLAKLNTISWGTLSNNIVNLITARRKNLKSGDSLNTTESYKQAQIQELRNQLPKNLNASTRQKMASIEVDGTSNEKLAFYKKLLENLKIKTRNNESSKGAQSTLNVKLKINTADTVAALNILRSDAEARNLKQYFNKKRAELIVKEKNARLANIKQKELNRKQTAASVAKYKKRINVAGTIEALEKLKNHAYTGDAKENINRYTNAKIMVKAIELGKKNTNLNTLLKNKNNAIKNAAEKRNAKIRSESARITEGIFSGVKKTQTASEERERIEKILKSNSSTKFENIFGFNKPNSKKTVQALTHPNKNPLNREVYNERFKYIDRFYETEPESVSGPLLLKNRTILNNIAAATSIIELNKFQVPSDGTKKNKIAFRNAMTARRKQLYKQNIQKASSITLNELEKKIIRLFPDLLNNINARRLQLKPTGGVDEVRGNIARTNALVKEAANKALERQGTEDGVSIYQGEVNNTTSPPTPRPGPKQLEYNRTHKVNAYINSLHKTKTVQNAVNVYKNIGQSIGGLDSLLARVNELMKNEDDFEKLSAAEKAYLNAKIAVPRIISSKLEKIRLGFWNELVNKELAKKERRFLKKDLAREHLMNHYKGGYNLPTKYNMEKRLESFMFTKKFVKPQVNTGRRCQGTETPIGERPTGLPPRRAAAHPLKKAS
jgi:hypothetical protein